MQIVKGEGFIPGPLLANINSPSDLKKLTEAELVQLCDELRQYIIDLVSVKGGHFGASLGVVELTAALHYVFNTPYDQLVWDVGHQAYGHKILTGRRDNFHTNRKYKGVSGFPKRDESEYDAFGVGHSSTSISAALGMAVASDYLGQKDKHHIAVIGDGAMTAGLAFEGMNHAGSSNANLLVVLNDNCMSIDPNVGALKEYLTDITTSHTYNNVKDEVWKQLGKLSKFGTSARDIVSKVQLAMKSSLLKQSNLFEALNFRYFGPVDGHDVQRMVQVLNDLKDIPGPKILHVLTKKGKGYKFSEEGNETVWHSPGLFNKDTGEIIKVTPKEPQPPKYQDVFGHTIVELAEKNSKIMGVTPAMPSGCSLNIMMKAMPDRAFDVAIAEQHAVTFSAGLATQGLIPFCNIYSSFMQRAYDQVIHDVALQKLHVVFCLDRGGLVGADGPTHHGTFDLAYFRCIPNMVVAAPMNEQELRNLMFTAQLEKNAFPFSIRYPRGNGVMVNWKTPFEEIEIGKGRKIKDGKDIAILTIGHIGNTATEAIKTIEEQNISVAHYDMRFVKPLDEQMLHEIFSTHKKLITIEDGCLQGGFGSAIIEFMSDNNYNAQVKRLGIADEFIEHGEPKELYDEVGLSASAIAEEAIKLVSPVKKIMKKILLVITSFILLNHSLKAQGNAIDQTFRPVIYAAVVGSQVDGDTYGGYSKPGFMLGVGINRQLSKIFEVEFALTFIQKGARHNYSLDSASRNNPANPFYLSRLNYLEIPLVLRANYKRFTGELGAAAAYLIQNPPNVQTNNPTYVDYKYRNFDFSYIVGIGMKLKNTWSVNFRFEYSIVTIHPYLNSYNGVFHGTFPQNLFNRGLYNNLLQLSLRYRIPTKSATTDPAVNAQ